MPGFGGQMSLGQAAGGRPRPVRARGARQPRPSWNTPRPRPGRMPGPQRPQSLGMVGGNMAPRMGVQPPRFGAMQAPAPGFQVNPGMQQVLQNRGVQPPQPMLQGSGGWGMAGGNMGGGYPQPAPRGGGVGSDVMQAMQGGFGQGSSGRYGGNMLGQQQLAAKSGPQRDYNQMLGRPLPQGNY